jgi:hypothetical protein
MPVEGVEQLKGWMWIDVWQPQLTVSPQGNAMHVQRHDSMS